MPLIEGGDLVLSVQEGAMHKSPYRLRRTLVAAAALAAIGSTPTQAANVSWVGSNASFWDLAANWSPGLPTAADDVLLGNFDTEVRSGSRTVQSLVGTGQLRLTGGALGMTQASSIGSLSISAGNLGGAGNLTVAGALSITGAGAKGIGVLNLNAGNTTWSGNTGNDNNVLTLSGAGVFNSAGTFTDANTFNSTISGGTFNNSGTFNKQSNTTTSISTVFNNTGTVNVNAGSMLMGGGGTSSGAFNIAAGAKIEFRNGTHTLNNVTTSGAGTLQISTENVGADASRDDQRRHAQLGVSAERQHLERHGPGLSGPGDLDRRHHHRHGGAEHHLRQHADHQRRERQDAVRRPQRERRQHHLDRQYRQWQQRHLHLGGRQSSTTPAPSPMPMAFDSSISAGGGGGIFNNNGIFNKQSNTTTTIGTVFNSTGTVNVNAGTMLMNGGGTSTGVFNIAAGAKLEYRNGSHTLNNVTTSGAGTLRDQHRERRRGCNGRHQRRHAHDGVCAQRQHPDGHRVTRSRARPPGRGGTITGAARRAPPSAARLTISGPNSKTLSGGRSVNAGNTTWSGNTGNGNNSINISGASVFNSSGTFTDANTFDSAINVGNGGGAFNNNGIFNKQSNTTTSRRHAVQQHRHGQRECRHDADDTAAAPAPVSSTSRTAPSWNTATAITR